MNADSARTEDAYDPPGDSLWPPYGRDVRLPGISGSQGDPRHPLATVRAVDTYQIYDGTDENGIVGTVPRGSSPRRAGAGG